MRLFAGLAVALFLLAAAAGALTFFAYQRANQPYKGFPEDEIFFTVKPGDSSQTIAQSLAARSIILDERLFRMAVWHRDAAGLLQAGEYRFSEPLSTFGVIDKLVRGDVYYVSVTVPEGLTLDETAVLLANRGLADLDALRESFSRPDLITQLDPDATSLEGYLFPETYRLPRRPGAEDVARALVGRFRSVFDETRRKRTEELDHSVREIVTLASVVEKETGQADERPLIASVFWNRLRRGMPLQSDPTVIYALKLQGEFDGNLRRSDLDIDSPYNTYRVAGLPPGPIASPGRHAIDAVLDPPDTSFLYFVSKNDGTHHFSKTLREHSAAVRKYQVEYFRNLRRQRTESPGTR